MRVAVVLEGVPHVGGGFQQSLSTIESLIRNNVTEHDFVVFTPHEKTRQFLSKQGIEAIRFKNRGYRLIDRWSATWLGTAVISRLHRLGLKRVGRHLDSVFDDNEIDLILLNECTEIVWRIGNHPYIVTVWDLDHRDYPEFPEAFSDRKFQRRERLLGISLTRAMAVIANSNSGARRIADLYQVDIGRIVVLPFLPSLSVRKHLLNRGKTTLEQIRFKYKLPACYVFYPAFFLPLKNHLYILEGLAALERQYGIVMHAVFCGGGRGGTSYRQTVERQVQALGLTERVKFLGLVPDEDVPALYEGAFALVMPAYSGPTNLPPLEAATLGCPVICSDLPGCREQLGDAALYCDLSDVSTLAHHLAQLTNNPPLIDCLKKAGRRLAAKLAEENYSKRLKPVLDRYDHVRRRWSWPQLSC